MDASVLVCIAAAVAGAAVMGVALARSPRVSPDIGEFLGGLGNIDIEQGVSEPIGARRAARVRDAVSRRLERLLPGNQLDKIDKQLAQAGLAGKRRAGQQLTMQVALALVGLALVPAVPAATPLRQVLALVLLPTAGFLLPSVRLKRLIRRRGDTIFEDLPDIVDMLAISVEAGCGFESALSLVCKNFTSPLTDELAMALQEMELGLARRDALQRLRERVDLDVVRVLVLSLLQADALGIPIGRVLKSQAIEVRARRRAWARERAAKLPVKIMFPLVAFIFPPIMALVLGPAMSSFGKL